MNKKYTMREVADMFGVSKQAIFNYVNDGLKQYVTQNERGHILLDDKVIQMIQQRAKQFSLKKNILQEVDNQTIKNEYKELVQNDSSSDINTIKLVASLQQQLSEKDKLIAEKSLMIEELKKDKDRLQSTNDKLLEMVREGQEVNASIKKLIEASVNSSQQVLEASIVRQTLWQRIFKR